jgi:hypothetical protein
VVVAVPPNRDICRELDFLVRESRSAVDDFLLRGEPWIALRFGALEGAGPHDGDPFEPAHHGKCIGATYDPTRSLPTRSAGILGEAATIDSLAARVVRSGPLSRYAVCRNKQKLARHRGRTACRSDCHLSPASRGRASLRIDSRVSFIIDALRPDQALLWAARPSCRRTMDRAES